MTLKQLASKIAKLEGKKHQASVGDVREIIGLVCDALYRDKTNDLVIKLYSNGFRRAKRRK